MIILTKTLGTRSTLTAVNAANDDALTASAVLVLILSQAARPDRDDLQGAVQSFTFDADEGVNVVVQNAGQREHLRNVLGFTADTVTQTLARDVVGVGRPGIMLGIPVTIWSVEI